MILEGNSLYKDKVRYNELMKKKNWNVYEHRVFEDEIIVKLQE